MPAKKKKPSKSKSNKMKTAVLNEWGLNAQQELFVGTYMQTFNIAEAYVKAGISSYGVAYEWIKKPQIRDEINRRKEEMLARHKIEASTALKLAWITVCSNIRDVVDCDSKVIKAKAFKQLSWQDTYCIKSISSKQGKYGQEFKITMHSRDSAMNFVGQYFSMLKDKEPIEKLISQLPQHIADPLRSRIKFYADKNTVPSNN